ncbi:MAG: carboxypeptidase-like regulatory domain-containing protein, partial [Ferruginibacter sp.]|nr:carboxypeptidase-like regulatory domain-containing protein [Cytophagales bacterium]
MGWLILLPAVAFSQVPFTLQGKISNDRNEPLVGASALVTGTGSGATADVEGNYRISGTLPAGSYQVVFNYVGYLSESKQIEVAPATNQFTIDMELVEDILSLNEVVVVGSTVSQERKQLG